MTAIAIHGKSSLSARTYSTGASEVSQRLQKFYENTVLSLRKSVTWNYLGNARDALRETYRECYEENWDGYG